MTEGAKADGHGRLVWIGEPVHLLMGPPPTENVTVFINLCCKESVAAGDGCPLNGFHFLAEQSFGSEVVGVFGMNDFEYERGQGI